MHPNTHTEADNQKPVDWEARDYAASFGFQRGSSLYLLVHRLRQEYRYKYRTDFTLTADEGKIVFTFPNMGLGEYILDAAKRMIAQHKLNLQILEPHAPQGH